MTNCYVLQVYTCTYACINGPIVCVCVCANVIKMILTQIGILIIPTILAVTRIQLKCNLVSHVIYTLARGTGVACIMHHANMI